MRESLLWRWGSTNRLMRTGDLKGLWGSLKELASQVEVLFSNQLIFSSLSLDVSGLVRQSLFLFESVALRGH